MDVALEKRRADADSELRAEILREAVDGVIRRGIAPLQQGIVAFDNFAFLLPQRRDVRVVQPQVIERGAKIGEELAGMAAVQVAHGGGEEDDIAQRIPAAKDELLFPRVRMREPARGSAR